MSDIAFKTESTPWTPVVHTNPEIKLIGKVVSIIRCTASIHNTRDSKCICCLVGKLVVIKEEYRLYDGTSSFEIHEGYRKFFIQRNEFLQQIQSVMRNSGKFKIVPV